MTDRTTTATIVNNNMTIRDCNTKFPLPNKSKIVLAVNITIATVVKIVAVRILSKESSTSYQGKTSSQKKLAQENIDSTDMIRISET